MSFYRKLSNFENKVQFESLLAELIDRFGKLPQEIINLANILKIKEKCKYLEIELLEVGSKGITIKFREGKVDNVTGLLAFIESDKGNIKPKNEKLFVKTKIGDALKSSYTLLKNIENFIKKEAPSKEGASYWGRFHTGKKPIEQFLDLTKKIKKSNYFFIFSLASLILLKL